ncbi:cyclin-dependent kinase inhibitor 1B-like [Rhinoderma darwinii]|uniref:cyclin-dependent kinase inhibitor 1B-like n=1 Tax=Rhinoderma darwinii TaxID=43563 RepID=UPI003F673321
MCDVQRAEGAPRPGSKVCRRLFGPVDHVELSRELHARLREMQEQSSRRWDFDFQTGTPLPSSRYTWQESGEETVPQFYRTPRISAAPDRTLPVITSSPPATPDCTPPALLARPAANKRSQPAAPITDFFPVRKKTKVVAALCDKLHSTSPIPTEHTPRKMIR